MECLATHTHTLDIYIDPPTQGSETTEAEKYEGLLEPETWNETVSSGLDRTVHS